MSATPGTSDRSTLNAVTPNLQIGQFADPALRLAVFQYLFDLSDANWSDVDTRIKDRYTKAQVDAAINSAVIGSVGSIVVLTGTTFPGSAGEGQTFYKTDEGRFYVYSSSSWKASASVADLNNLVGNTLYAQQNLGGF